jgi:hypothetical protein
MKPEESYTRVFDKASSASPAITNPFQVGDCIRFRATGPSFQRFHSWESDHFSEGDPGSSSATNSLAVISLLEFVLSHLRGLVVEDLDKADMCREAYDRALHGLLRSRDFLGLQLDHAWGNIDDQQFEESAGEYLDERDQPITETEKRAVSLLLQESQVPLDTETLSEAFGCRLSDVETLTCSVGPGPAKFIGV